MAATRNPAFRKTFNAHSAERSQLCAVQVSQGPVHGSGNALAEVKHPAISGLEPCDGLRLGGSVWESLRMAKARVLDNS